MWRYGKPADEVALPPAIRRAVSRVQADFRAMSEIAWEWVFENDPDPEAPSVLCVMGTVRGGMGVTVRWDADEEDAAAYLADEWNEQVFETMAEDDLDLAQRWPLCPRPGHDHALDPTLYRNLAAWICHEDRTVVAIIGQLGNH